jgi:hypothetical protein
LVVGLRKNQGIQENISLAPKIKSVPFANVKPLVGLVLILLRSLAFFARLKRLPAVDLER